MTELERCRAQCLSQGLPTCSLRQLNSCLTSTSYCCKLGRGHAHALRHGGRYLHFQSLKSLVSCEHASISFTI